MNLSAGVRRLLDLECNSIALETGGHWRVPKRSESPDDHPGPRAMREPETPRMKPTPKPKPKRGK